MILFIYLIILVILVLEFGAERILSVLNIQYSSKELPAPIADVFDSEKYRRQQEYFRTNARFGSYTSTFNFLITLCMFAFGGFGWLDQMVASLVQGEILRSLIFFGIIFLVSDFINIPFQWYDTFVIEEKFGFNKITPRLFILDKLKGYGLSALIGGGLMALIIWIYGLTPHYFWVLAWGLVTAFSLFMGMFYSELIVPLFNKQTPLPDGELRTEIEKFAVSAGFTLKNIYVIDGSKRSTKANAYFTGWGPKKRIVLYDTLMDKLTTAEIVAVLAHEIGHYKRKHVLKNMLLSIPTSLLLFYLLGLMLGSNVLAEALGGVVANFHLNVLAFGILYTPVSVALDLLTNVFSRKFEYQADNFANEHGCGDALVSGLKKLSATSLSNLMPHPAYVFLHYSHPTLYQRIMNIKR